MVAFVCLGKLNCFFILAHKVLKCNELGLKNKLLNFEYESE